MHAPPVAALRPAVRRAILGLGVTQILGWGSTYYLLSLLGSTIGRDLGLSNGLMLAGISITLASAAIFGPSIGRWQDRAGSRIVMTTGSVIMATGLCILSLAHSWSVYYAGWIVIGIGSPMALYSASFTALTQIAGQDSRRAISYLTFMGGLASTISWPVTAWLMNYLDWRTIALLFAALNLAICAPIHATCLGRRLADDHPANGGDIIEAGISREAQPAAFIILSAMLALTGSIVNSWSLLVFPVLMGIGFLQGAAVFVGSIVGVWQVAGRMAEMLLARRLSIFWTGLVAIGFMPLSFLFLLYSGGNVAVGTLFAAFYGISNGLITIARGGIILAIFGARGYGERINKATVAQNITGALAPIAGGYALDGVGATTVVEIMLGISTAAFLLMLLLRRHCALNGLR
jgi:predicted MFS family arabinose efflux permease